MDDEIKYVYQLASNNNNHFLAIVLTNDDVYYLEGNITHNFTYKNIEISNKNYYTHSFKIPIQFNPINGQRLTINKSLITELNLNRQICPACTTAGTILESHFIHYITKENTFLIITSTSKRGLCNKNETFKLKNLSYCPFCGRKLN